MEWLKNFTKSHHMISISNIISIGIFLLSMGHFMQDGYLSADEFQKPLSSASGFQVVLLSIAYYFFRKP